MAPLLVLTFLVLMAETSNSEKTRSSGRGWQAAGFGC